MAVIWKVRPTPSHHIARGRKPSGPFEGGPDNPVVSARSTNRPIQNTGHGDLVQTPDGNVLWDCVSFVDQETVDSLAALGGVSAIAISHPHFYSSMIEWSQAFGDVPIHLHNGDAAWVSRPDPRVTFWAGETYPIVNGLTLVRCGGHFDGSSVLHVAG